MNIQTNLDRTFAKTACFRHKYAMNMDIVNITSLLLGWIIYSIPASNGLGAVFHKPQFGSCTRFGQTCGLVGPCKGGYPSPLSEYQSLVCRYFGCRTSLRLCWPTSEENFTRQSYTSGTAEQVLEWGGLSRLALSILNLGGSGGMLPREIFKMWVPEWLTMQCGPCTCSHVTATPIKGLPTGTFLFAQSEFHSRNGWKYRICRRFISYKFRCRKFSSAHCRHFVARVSLFQGHVACRNLPHTGSFWWYIDEHQALIISCRPISWPLPAASVGILQLLMVNVHHV